MDVTNSDSPWLDNEEYSRAYRYPAVAPVAMLAFEYITTLDREIDFLWDHKLSWAKVVFLLNRYIGLLYYFCSFAISLPGQDFSVSARFTIVVAIPKGSPFNEQSCKTLTRVTQACNPLLYAAWAAFAGLRAHAVTKRNWKITLPMVLLGLTTVIIDVYIMAETTISPSTSLNCVQIVPEIAGTTLHILFILSRTCALLSNGLVLAATWVQTWSTIRTAREFGLSASFASFLLWHGLQTFGTLSVINITEVVVSFVPFNGVVVVPRVLIPVFVSRFFLYLHGLGTQDTEPTLPTLSAVSLSFPRGHDMYLAEMD